MRGRFRSKPLRSWFLRLAAVCVLLVVFSVFTMLPVMANTVSATVMDGEASYTFSMNRSDLESVLAQAMEQGLEPLGPLDVAERVGNTTTVNVRRGVQMRVTEAGRVSEWIAYKGDTVRKALAENNILLKDGDVVNPGRDLIIETDLSVDVKRACEVTVTIGEESQVLSMTGGTVADALEEAGIRLSSKDACNYSLEEPLFDKMNLRISRAVNITVTADGRTKTYEVPTQRVQAALERCGVKLGRDDRLNVSRADLVEDGMSIQVQRVEVAEEETIEDLPYSTRYEYSSDLYVGEEEVKTPGETGKKETRTRVTYVEGVEESREVLFQAVTKEPIEEVVRTGTRQRVSAADTGAPMAWTHFWREA